MATNKMGGIENIENPHEEQQRMLLGRIVNNVVSVYIYINVTHYVSIVFSLILLFFYLKRKNSMTHWKI